MINHLSHSSSSHHSQIILPRLAPPTAAPPSPRAGGQVRGKSTAAAPSVAPPSPHVPLLALLMCLLLLLLSALPCSAAASASRSSSPSVAPTPLVPALFVIGDSTADVGTNNYLGTLARADREPYGRDFDTHRPTGRFSNGRIPVDYLAEKLGLPFVPPYLEQSMRMGVGSVGLSNIDGMIQGVNYASAAAGILSSSGSEPSTDYVF